MPLPHYMLTSHERDSKMAKGRKERQKGMKSEEENRRRNENKAEGRVDGVRKARERQTKQRRHPHHTYCWLTHFGLLSLLLCIPAASGICHWDQSHVVSSVNQDLSAHELKIQTDKWENRVRDLASHTQCGQEPRQQQNPSALHPTTTLVTQGGHRAHTFFFFFVARADSSKWFLRALRIHLPLSKDGSGVWVCQAPSLHLLL